MAKSSYRRALLPGLLLLGLLLLALAGVGLVHRSAGIPPSVTLQGEFSKVEAEALYRAAKTMVNRSYWEWIWFDVKRRDFTSAWYCFTGGHFAIQGLAKDQDGNVNVLARHRNGKVSLRIKSALAAPSVNPKPKAF